jgi:cation:H+ antiporter
LIELLTLAGALVVILVAAELFTNGVEWFGRALNLGAGAVGGVLAAVGTALPETMIPLVAILLGGSSGTGGGDEIGVGAILGAPFMLSTLAMFATGAAVLVYRRRRATGTALQIDTTVMGTDIRYFFAAYAVAVATAFVPADLAVMRYAAAAAVLLIYVAYVRRQLAAGGADEDEELAPLRFRRLDPSAHRTAAGSPPLPVVTFQVVVAVVLIIGGAVFFVDAVQRISLGLGVNPALLALVIAPIATELPETSNSLLWVRHNKDALALGNITGAMVFQASIPTAIGITLASASWVVTAENALTFASAAIAFASTAVIFVPMSRRGTLRAGHLLVGGLLYLAYVGLVVSRLAGLW